MLKKLDKTALIVIDLQNDYFHEKGQMGLWGHGTKHLHKMIPKIQNFIDAFRDYSSKVIWTQMTECKGIIDTKLGEKRIKEAGKLNEWELCIPDTKGFELMINPHQEDMVFEKIDENLFSNKNIEKYLKDNGIQNLLFIGGYTHKCVYKSILSAIKLGFNPIIIQDLVGSPKKYKSRHDNVINSLKRNKSVVVLKSKNLFNYLIDMQDKECYQNYFETKKNKILSTLKAYNKTKAGIKKNINPKNIKTYNDFLKIPILSSNQVSKTPYSYVLGDIDKFVIKRTSGTTGKPRLIFHDPKTRTATYPQKFKEFLYSHKNELLIFHRKADVTSNFMIDRAIKKISQDIIIGQFSSQEEGIQILLDNKEKMFLYIPELTTVWKRFAYFLEQSIANGIISTKDLKKDFVNLEFTGEYMSLDELKKISDQAESIFGVKPEITVCYGMTEQSGIGVYLYDENDKEMWYKVKENKFVEILNNKKTLIQEDGEIIVTQLDWNKGTILPRYNTQDLGKAKFKDGILYIMVYPRERTKGWFTISTNNYNAAEIIKDIEKKYNIIFQGEFQILETKDLKEVLIIRISSSSFTDPELVKEIEDRIVDVIFEQLSKASQQYVKIKFESSTDLLMNKCWAVKKKIKSKLNFDEF